MMRVSPTVLRPLSALVQRRAALRALGLCALVGSGSALAAGLPRGLGEVLHARGLRVLEGGPRWLDPPSFGLRRALVLAAADGAVADVYAVTARTDPRGRVLSLVDVSNLTRSPDAAEEDLVQAGPWAAFASRVGDRYAAVTLLDLGGVDETDPDGPPPGRGQRLRDGLSRLQQTGRARGYGQHRFDLASPARVVSLRIDGDVVAVRADRQVFHVEAPTRRVREGSRWARHRPRLSGTTGWVTWAVDTVRSIPWIGGAPIAWAEHLAFGVQHEVARARVRLGTDTSAAEASEDLADILHHGPPAALEGPVEGWPPAPAAGLLRPPLAHEGQWNAAAPDDPFLARNPGAPPAFYQTFVRTDRERPDTRVYVTLWDPRQLELHVVPGSQEPIGATGETGSGSIPRDGRTLTRLAAGFNGGFQALHGEWGVYAEGTLFLPPKPWGATLFALEGGDTGFGSWPGERGQIPAEVSEFRQNLTSLVEDGQFNPYRRTFWGGNVPGAPEGETHTARTGLCMTREEFVAFFWGNGLTERSLADAMLGVRCTYGVHLDMNGANTGFEFLRVTPTAATPPRARPLTVGEHEGPVPSAAGYTVRARRMVRGMHEMGFPRYIKRDPRDFFYLLLRPVLPGEPLRPPVSPSLPGEGRWRVEGLSEAPFPWPMARTRVRPDPAQPDRWVNLVRIDPRRVTLAPAEATGAVVAQVIGVEPPAPGALRIAWTAPGGTPRWEAGTEGSGFAGVPFTPGLSVSRGVGVDGEGFLVFAVADRASPGLVAAALDLAGCGARRLALQSGALRLPNGQDAAGASLDPGARPTYALVLRDAAGARRMFPEVTPVPQRVWYDAQHRRVRYQRDEDGAVRVQLTGGQRVTAPTWGRSTPRDAGAASPGTAVPGPRR